MEALAAISLAGNVLQFVHLGLVVLEQVKGFQDGTTYRDYASLREELADLKKLSVWLRDPSTSVANEGLRIQADKCLGIAVKMESEINKLGINSSNKKKAWWGIVKSPFIARVLDRLGQELNLVQGQMQLYLTATQKYDLPT